MNTATGEPLAATTICVIPDLWSRPVSNTFHALVETEWLDEAACADLAVEAAFPDAGGTATPEMVAACDRCPVRPECLRHALDRPVSAGYIAGTTPAQRRRMR